MNEAKVIEKACNSLRQPSMILETPVSMKRASSGSPFTSWQLGLPANMPLCSSGQGGPWKHMPSGMNICIYWFFTPTALGPRVDGVCERERCVLASGGFRREIIES